MTPHHLRHDCSHACDECDLATPETCAEFAYMTAEHARVCPVCGSTRLFGPAEVRVDGEAFSYYDCSRCHRLLLVVGDRLEPRAGARSEP